MSPRQGPPPRRPPARPGTRAGTRPAPARRRDRPATRITALFGAVVVVTLAMLGGLALAGALDHDWHAAVTIDGTGIGRADFRNRAAVLTALSVARGEVATGLWMPGTASTAERDALIAAADPGDLTTATVDDLVRERTLRDEAAAAGITAGSVDPWAEFATAAADPTAIHVRFVTLAAPTDAGPAATVPDGWPVAPPGGATTAATLAARDETAARALAMLAESPAAAVVEAASAAGWIARGEDTWIGPRGPEAGVPATLVTAARRIAAAPGPLGATPVGPIDDEASATVVAGIVLGRGPEPDVAAVRRSVETLGLDEAWLRPWAEARVLARALEDARTATWSTTPSALARVREVIVSPAGLTGEDGPYVGLARLVIEQLPPGELPAADPHPIRTGGTPGAVLADDLRALPQRERLARWDALVAAANRATPGDSPIRSGEMGWRHAGGLTPELAAAATGAGAYPGLVIGPFTTELGQELYLVRGLFPGVLDERAAALLTELTTSADLAAVAARVAPGAGSLRYERGVTRSELEALDNEPARLALFSDAKVQAGRPYILGGEILVAVPVSRETAVPTGQALDRIACAAFEAWIGERMATRTVSVDANPFGASGVGEQATPAATAVPTVAPMATPPVITVPGQSPVPDPLATPVP